MKVSASTNLFLRPLKWLRKIRGFRLVYTPLLAIVIFTAVMGIILGTLHLQEKNQQEAALFRELSFAKQRIQSRFASNLDALTTINREVAASDDQVKLRQIAREQADDLVVNNHEIVKIIWLNNQAQREWAAPNETSKSDWITKTQNDQPVNAGLASTIELSRVTGRAAFSPFISLNLPGDEPINAVRSSL